MKSKISIIGMGNVGSTTAYTLAHKKAADEIVMLDVLKDPLEGHSLDLAHSLAWDNDGVVYHGDYPDMEGSRIVIVCAGSPRKPGMTRLQLTETNAAIIKQIAASIQRHASNAIIITVTNPVDVMNYVMWRATGFPRERVIGQGGALDTLRFRWAVSQVLGVRPVEVDAYVIGEHGNSKVPLFSSLKIRGKKREISVEDKIKITELMEKSNEDVVRKKGATVFGPAQALMRMVDAIVCDKKEVIPCSMVLKGEYGINDVSIGTPVVLGKNGAEKIEIWPMEHVEEVSFKRSAELISGALSKV